MDKENLQSDANLEPKFNKKPCKTLLTFIIAFSTLFILLISVKIISNMEIFSKPQEDDLLSDEQGQTNKPFLQFYEPDWETDIATMPEYLELNRVIKYSPDGIQSFTIPNKNYIYYGGEELAFMAEYINTIISGDNEKLNTLFTENYFIDNDKYAKFPMQKIHDVKIRKYNYNNSEYENNANIDATYYVVSYSIFQNDGYFRNDIDSTCELPLLFCVLTNKDEGTILIDEVISLPNYNG